MLPITNHYYNNKNKKKRDKIDRKYLKIQSKRLSEEDRKPLNDHEKYLYREEINIPCTKIGDGFYKFNKISHILVVVPKTDINGFYNSCVKVLIDNPINGFGSTILDERTRQSILKIGERSNTSFWSRVCCITPKMEYIKYVDISVFNVSTAFFGVCFDVIWDDIFQIEINNMLISDESYRQKYCQVLVNGKKIITKMGNNNDCIRRRKCDDVLLEYKLRIYNYLNKYFKLPNCYKEMPLSLDEYVTNLKIDDRFILSQGYFSPFIEKTKIDLSLLVDNSKYVNTTCYFDLSEENLFESDYKIKRSRLLIHSEQDINYISSINSMASFYVVMIRMYKLEEYDSLLMKKQGVLNKSFGLFPKIIFGDYRKYLSISNKTTSVKSIIMLNEDLQPNPFELKYTFYDKHMREWFLKLLKRENEMDQTINDVMSLRTNRFALYISLISLAAAIIAIIISCIK